jgi:hypothetical protein
MQPRAVATSGNPKIVYSAAGELELQGRAETGGVVGQQLVVRCRTGERMAGMYAAVFVHVPKVIV